MRDAAQKCMKQRGAPASRLQFIMLVPSIPDHRDVCAEKLLPEHRRSTFDGGIPAFLSGCADHFQIDTVDSRTTEKRGGDTAYLSFCDSNHLCKIFKNEKPEPHSAKPELTENFLVGRELSALMTRQENVILKATARESDSNGIP